MSDAQNEVARRARKIARELARADSGEKAAARRMGPEGAPVLWRMVARLGIDRSKEEKWLRITRALALLTPASVNESIHEDERWFGAVLADGGDVRARLDEKPFYSEQRLARLLAACRDARLDALDRAVRMLARKRPHVDVPSLAWAYLNENGRWIARSYYDRLYSYQDASQEEQSDV